MPSLFPGPQVVTLTTCARGGVGVRTRRDVAEVTDSHRGYPRRSPRGGDTCINAARPWSRPTTRYSSTHKVAAPNITHQGASFIIFCLGDYNLKSKGSVFLFYTSRKFIQKGNSTANHLPGLNSGLRGVAIARYYSKLLYDHQHYYH